MSAAREGATGAKPAERETVVSGQHGRVERVGSLLVIVVRDGRMFGSITQVLRFARDWVRAGNPKLAIVALVAPRELHLREFFEESVRSRFARLAGEFEQCVAGHCVVLEVDGFVAAAVRSVRSGILLAARPSMPMHVCTDLDEGIDWARKLLPAGAPSRGELRAAIDALR